MREVDVAIIGAGTAGLSARSKVAKETDNYVVIDDGPLGTTCARVGCMPSKVLIQVAEDFHRRHKFAEQGILGAEHLQLDQAKAMQHVRKLRDRFTNGVIGSFKKWEDKLIRKRARFIDQNTLDLGDEQIKAKNIIIGTGSKPIVPAAWSDYQKYFITSDEFFELETLPETVAVIGLGVIGIELGQSLSRMGVKVIGISLDKSIGALSDPKLQDYAANLISQEFETAFGKAEISGERNGKLVVSVNENEWEVDKAFLTMGRAPAIKDLQLENAGIELDKRGMPKYDRNTMQIPGTRIFFAGDVNGERPLLHEASDEGDIAGYNAVRPESQCFRRRDLLAITFSDPNIAIVGQSYRELTEAGIDFATGSVCFEGFGRAIVKLKEKGLLHVYGDKQTGNLLGAEMIAPDGEHMAHQLSWSISMGQTVTQVLSLPFYHPVMEEGLRTAFRDLHKQVKAEASPLEVMRCQDPPAGMGGP